VASSWRAGNSGLAGPGRPARPASSWRAGSGHVLLLV